LIEPLNSKRDRMLLERTFLIGYNRLWRGAFLLLAVYMLLTAGFFIVQYIQGQSDGFAMPLSVSIAAVFLGLYLMPLVMTPQQRLDVTADGLILYGERSNIILPWKTIQDSRFKHVMFFMPYLTIALSDKSSLAKFIEDNPRSFIARWTAHVSVMRRYPLVLRWLFSVPKAMSTLSTLAWLERRYGGALVIDVVASNGRAKELQALLLLQGK
jgi:hypothetical protein